jgi:hypothetical protein
MLATLVVERHGSHKCTGIQVDDFSSFSFSVCSAAKMAGSKSTSMFGVFLVCLLLLSTLCLADIEFRLPRGRDRSKTREQPQMSNAQRFSTHQKRAVNGSECIEAKPTVIKAPKKNVWRQLNGNETSAVSHWLHQQKELDLSREFSYSGRGNGLVSVELQIPNKTDVLAYLDGSGAEPPRYARALISMDSVTPSTYNYLLVGPLPITSQTTWQPLTFPFTSKTGSIRNVNWNIDKVYDKLSKVTGQVQNITRNLWPGAKSPYYYGA